MHGHIRLRQPDVNAPTFFPDRIRSSTLALAPWCDFDCLDKIQSPIIPDELSQETDATATGTIMHKVLEDSTMHFEHEKLLLDELNAQMDKELGFVREFRGTKITIHPDDLQCLPSGRVSVIEYKTTSIYVPKTKTWEQASSERFGFIKQWYFPKACFQAQIYAWVLEPILEKLGYFIDNFHEVIYFDSANFRMIGEPLLVAYFRSKEEARDFGVLDWQTYQTVEDKLNRIFDYISDPSKCIPPADWKCRSCLKTKREKCVHYARLTAKQTMGLRYD